MFDALDTDRDGAISLEDLLAAVREGHLGMIHSESACAAFMATVDVDEGHHTLDYDHFHAYMRQRELVLSKLFRRIDENDDGSISVSELHHYLSRVLGRKVPLSEAEALLLSLDSDKNGTIDYQELLQGTLLASGNPDAALVDAFSFFCRTDGKPVGDPSLRTLIAGFMAGAASRTATAPFDRCSILMRAGNCSLAASGNALGTLAAMWKQGGVRSLWSGNLILCLTVAPENAIMFYGYNWLKPHLCRNPEAPTMLEKLGAGGLAGMVAITLVFPLYVAQARMALAGPGKFSGLADFVVKTLRTEGMEMMAYNSLCEAFVPPGEQPTVAQSLAFGAVSAVLSQSLTMPLLSLRTKMMGQAPSLGRPILYKDVIDCTLKTIRGDPALGLPAEGVAGLYKGLSALLMKMVPCTGIQFASYEAANRLLQAYMA